MKEDSCTLTVTAPNPYPDDPLKLKELLRYETENDSFRPFIHGFGEGEGEYPVEANRYRLVLGRACPFSHRIEIIYNLLGLEKVISAGLVSPAKTPEGWKFLLDPNEEDPVLHIKTLGETYSKVVPGYTGRASIPSLIDVPSGKVVTCDDLALGYDLELAWKEYHRKNAPDLYPEDLRKEINDLNQVITDEVITGAYAVYFSETQEEYDRAFDIFFNRLDELDKRLSGNKYLFGDTLTDSDTKLFPSLVRFDLVYYHSFHADRNSLREFSNLWRYAHDLYRIDEFRRATDFDAVRRGYYLGNLFREPKILFRGPDLSYWN
jgi:putative glutathione S-transferase